MGGLPESPSLAVSIHLEACPACRAAVREIEEAEGRLLALEPGAPLAPRALDDIMVRLDELEAAPLTNDPIFGDQAIKLPRSLAHVRFTSPAYLGPDVWVAHLDAPRREGWRTYLFCGPANTALPPHGHHGEELIVVLEGEFSDHRQFRAGDFAENPVGFSHDMRVSPHGRLLALVAAAGPIAWRGEDRRLGDLFDI